MYGESTGEVADFNFSDIKIYNAGREGEKQTHREELQAVGNGMKYAI